jgi:hypothetical protein
MFRELVAALDQLGVGKLLLQPDEYLIYALVDPETGITRYIGLTRWPEQREEQHLKDDRSNKAKQGWIDDLASRGRQPYMRRLEVVKGGLEAAEREMMWIQVMLEAGMDLVNVVTESARVSTASVMRLPTWLTKEKQDQIRTMYTEQHRSLGAICREFGFRAGGTNWYAVRGFLEREGLYEEARR